ncbi:uncharacterized protein BX664DRAFT_347621 [Halteromyces radiatus]|uniref:uncharacterized protein n=1 Tax=Halteromyces radiatus TaxID=101107 RepID=UPI00221E4B69|nr:uncharacterized protein BX664DRAFT_347621 [Halteromyces radiatus]KAI8097660.1 hypothetical protein BX664DRAFT_347621 [Halteromyces radiatus]
MLPKKIIKANASYTAQQPHELSFEKGDFFHVIGRENDHHWFAVNNPLTNLSGLVPVSYFEVVDKTTRTMSIIQPNMPKEYYYQQQQQNNPNITNRRSSTQQQHYYGIVLYDFIAERSDELGCKANEAIIIIAQSNSEWYVAKPIGRLGGPGLIPVSFVQLHDVITDHPIILPKNQHRSLPSSSSSSTTSISPRSSISIPQLDKWKKQIQNYEASSILLTGNGKQQQQHILPSSSSVSSSLSDHHHHYPSSQRHIEKEHKQGQSSTIPQRYSYDQSSLLSNHSMNHQKHQQRSQKTISYKSSAPPSLTTITSTTDSNIDASTYSESMVTDITVNSFILEDDQYWFVLYATVHKGNHRILYRTYNDFYHFHARLLQDYPIEAGKEGQERILPYMPGPLETVDDQITEQRREDLDYYCKKLLTLPSYLSKSELVQDQLFGLKKGDVETDYAPKKGSRVAKSTNTRPHQPTTEISNLINNNTIEQTTKSLYDKDGKEAYYNGGVGKVKIKIVHKDDIFAIKMPADCTLQELQLRVKDRLGGTLGKMKYKDDIHHSNGICLPLETELDMEEAFILAIQRGKLTILVD